MSTKDTNTNTAEELAKQQVMIQTIITSVVSEMDKKIPIYMQEAKDAARDEARAEAKKVMAEHATVAEKVNSWRERAQLAYYATGALAFGAAIVTGGIGMYKARANGRGGNNGGNNGGNTGGNNGS